VNNGGWRSSIDGNAKPVGMMERTFITMLSGGCCVCLLRLFST
jgi:hypothetical protein